MNMIHLSSFMAALVVAATTVWVFASSSAAHPTTNCPTKCGNFTINYPFGIGTQCALSTEFTLRCLLNDDGIYYPLLGHKQILEISQTQLSFRGTQLAASCISQMDQQINPYISVVFNGIGSSYVLASKDNAFMIVGCNLYGLLNADTIAGRKLTSCVSICTDRKDMEEHSCSGIGCCQSPLPKGLQKFNASLELISRNSSLKTVDCGYSFVAKKSSLAFRRASEVELPGFEEKVDHLPIVFDWFISNTTCREYSRNKTAHLCKQNTVCVDVEQELGVYGYRCKCISGFEGNPYVDNGCKDIDECKGPSNPCSHTCTNTKGSFICSCPRGYHTESGSKFQCFRNKMSIFLPIGISIGLGSILLLIVGYWGYVNAGKWKLNKQKAANFKRNGGLLLKQRNSSEQGMTEKNLLFTAAELDKATDHFSDDRILGRGGQGTVYKGMLGDGSLVAIKKHKLDNRSQLEEFINEIAILSAINHRNIVRLLGCCLETDVPLLVYEYIVNGALSKYLHRPQNDYPITWPMRLQIALDVASAIYYLHSSSSSPILHMDIKTDNVLLDEKYRAKLSDFGTSRSMSVDKSHVTTQLKGTFGYLDHEFHRTGRYNDKSDVYAFGVVIIELLTGKKAVYQTKSGVREDLASGFKEAMRKSTFQEMLAAEVVNEVPGDTIAAITKLATQCLDEDRTLRPTMRVVQLELEAIARRQSTTISFLRLPAIAEASSSETADTDDDEDDSDGIRLASD